MFRITINFPATLLAVVALSSGKYAPVLDPASASRRSTRQCLLGHRRNLQILRSATADEKKDIIAFIKSSKAVLPVTRWVVSAVSEGLAMWMISVTLI